MPIHYVNTAELGYNERDGSCIFFARQNSDSLYQSFASLSEIVKKKRKYAFIIINHLN